jgi:hypothetical protein
MRLLKADLLSRRQVAHILRKDLREGPEEKQQVPPLRCASVGMTILWQGDGPKTVRRMAVDGPTELSSRPKRSVVEGPAVSLPVLTHIEPSYSALHSKSRPLTKPGWIAATRVKSGSLPTSPVGAAYLDS